MKLKNRPTNLTQYPLALSAVQSEDDELIKAIEDDHKSPDYMWDLNSESYMSGADGFWDDSSEQL
jgi:hypothetical protein